MNQVEAVRSALREAGDVSAEELVGFIRTNYGVRIRPQIVPILKATSKDEEILAAWRRKLQMATHTPVAAEGQPKAS